MPPNLTGSASLLLAGAEVISDSDSDSKQQIPVNHSQDHYGDKPRYRWQIVWRNVIAFIYLHTGAIYGLYLLLTLKIKFATFLWAYFIIYLGGMGITAGAHRLWAHKTYKARWPLRLFLMICQTMAFQNHIYEWVRDHRVHHKFCDTDADPHNSTRGFFFSHIGWLMIRKHNWVKTKGKAVDMSDMDNDWVVRMQKNSYIVVMPLVCFVFPAFVPWYFWNEKFWYSWYVASILRYVLSLHGTWLVNSAAHIWGTKPYDKNISPTENVHVSLIAFGEGWHNYHHAFPWDYKTSELGDYKFNFTTAFIDFFSKIGWAYDLKTASVDMIKRRALRTGDGSRNGEHSHEGELWGWGDKDMTAEDLEIVMRINPDKKEN